MLEFKLPILIKIYIVKQEIPLLNTTYNIVHPPPLYFGPLNLKLGDQSQTPYHGGTGKTTKASVQNQAI